MEFLFVTYIARQKEKSPLKASMLVIVSQLEVARGTKYDSFGGSNAKRVMGSAST